jgi:RNA polymerase sigma factor (sigma-70 family)
MVNLRGLRCYPPTMTGTAESVPWATGGRESGLPLTDAAPDDDLLLLRGTAGGDPRALAELYRRHAPGLFGFLYRMAGDRAVAEEILQDTMLAVWQSAGGFGGRSAVRTWLYGVARRQAHNRLRSLSAPATGLDELPEPPAAGPGPEEITLARADVAAVGAAMAALPTGHREVLALAFHAGLGHADIARVLDVPVGTVKSRLHNARAKLVELLGTEETSR